MDNKKIIKKVIKKKYFNLDYKTSPTEDCLKYIKSYNQKKFTKHIYTDSVVRGDYCSCLISILFNTNNIENTVYSIKQFLDKANNPEKIQFCIKIDNDSEQFVKEFLKSLEKFQCNFVILSSPKGRGYVDLWQWINYLFKVSSKKSSFVLNTSDEMFIKETNWDINLSKYINLFNDSIFRLRTSVYKNRNYNTLWECGYAPDTTAIYSRKYLTIQGGFSPCFGPDNGQQFVAYYLSKLNYPRHYQFLRDYVINDITFGGQGTNADMHGASLRERQVINYQLWNNMFKHVNQEDYYLRARKIQIAILSEFKNTDNKMIISHNHYKKNFTVFIKDTNDENLKIILGYKINKYIYNLDFLRKLDFFKYHTSSRNKYIMGLTVHYLMQYMNIHPEEILYKEKYGPYELYKIIINEENKVREVTLKNFIFIIIYIFGATYFYIANKKKRQKYKNFLRDQLRKTYKNFRLNYLNQDIMKDKVFKFIFKINKKLLEKVNSLQVKKLLSYNSKSNVSYNDVKFNKPAAIIYNMRWKKNGFTFVYTIINSFYEVFYETINFPLSYISRNIYRISFNQSSKNKIFKSIYNLFKIVFNLLRFILVFIDIFIYLLFNFVSYSVRIIFFQIPEYIILNLFLFLKFVINTLIIIFKIIFNRFKSIIEDFSLLKILYVNTLYRSYNILITTTKTIYFFVYATNFLNFMFFILISPYNIFIYLFNNRNFIYKLYFILYPKKIDNIKYTTASVVALSTASQIDQSKVIILKGDS